MEEIPIPREYQSLREAFSKKRASHLPPNCPCDCAIDLLPQSSPPKGKMFPLLIPESTAMEEYIEEALAAGYIRPSTSPAAASFFFVGKKDGGLRPCINYHGLNDITYVIAYIDDILIFSASYDEHIGHVRRVLVRQLQHHLFVKAEKCEFHHDTITFLGYVISQKGVKMDESKVETVTNWPEPTTVKELQRFLGFANFYQRFIRGYSSIVSPLTSLLKGPPKCLRWNEDAWIAFIKLKRSFITAQILQHPDPERLFIVEVDGGCRSGDAVHLPCMEGLLHASEYQCESHLESLPSVQWAD
ncbi:hypothetical protein QTP70_010070 [Hemibagrus guttatus]|uniref:ribonuclease H n=1 Tax=Hemibagrus guttatus TaxID=175788 RepID=A0AAE0V7L7_9TELE|nr:hypothetical protein QTP70_010070 [Hemibagrus guttatus]KAK3565506.1 hypothetical protein QTP86_011051 [Hemibagrus guttatus]